MELGKRGLRGYFFSYGQYQELKKIADLKEAKEKISEFGFPSVMEAGNEKEVVNIIRSEEKRKERNGCFVYIVFEMIFWIVLSLLTCS
jgi:hypothetical protein